MDPAAEYVRIPVTPGSKIYGIGKCALNSWLRQRWTKYFAMWNLYITKVFEILQIQSIACIGISKFRRQQFILIECNKRWLPIWNYKICCFISFGSQSLCNLEYNLLFALTRKLCDFEFCDVGHDLFGLTRYYDLNLFWCKVYVWLNSARVQLRTKDRSEGSAGLCLAVSW